MSHIKEVAKLNQLKYVFSEEVNKATIFELKTIGIGNFVDGANWAIDKACEWLRNNVVPNGAFSTLAFKEEDIQMLKKAMEEE